MLYEVTGLRLEQMEFRDEDTEDEDFELGEMLRDSMVHRAFEYNGFADGEGDPGGEGGLNVDGDPGGNPDFDAGGNQ